MPIAVTLSIRITVDIHEDTAALPETTVLCTPTIASWASVETHHMAERRIGGNSRDPKAILWENKILILLYSFGIKQVYVSSKDMKNAWYLS